jgi:hypothetical protein
LVRKSGFYACARFDKYVDSEFLQGLYAFGHQGHAAFASGDFLWDSDDHFITPVATTVAYDRNI